MYAGAVSELITSERDDDVAVVPSPSLVLNVLEPSLHASFQLYMKELSRHPEIMVWDEWAKRLARHNDPFACLIHKMLTPQVQRIVGHPVKPSYVFIAAYSEHGWVPPHRDREQCKYTLDLGVTLRGPEWPLFINRQPYVLNDNEAIVYRGCELTHYREQIPEGATAHLAFFHFVDEDFEGSLD